MDKTRNILSFAALLISVFLIFGFNNVITASSSALVFHLGGDAAAGGLLNSAYILGGVLLRFCVGPIADRTTNRACMLAGAGIFVITTPFLAIADSLVAVFTIRLIQSIGLATYLPCASALVGKIAPVGKIGRWVSMYRFFTILSLTIGPLVFFPLADDFGYPTFFAALSVVAFFGLIFLLPVRERRQEKTCNSFGSAERADEVYPDAPRSPQGAATIIPILAATACGAVAYSFVFGFGKVIFDGTFSELDSGVVFTFVGLGGAATTLVFTVILDRVKPVVSIGLSILALSIACAFFACAKDIAFVLVAATLYGSGYFGVLSATISEVAKKCSADRRSTAMAYQQNTIDIALMAGNACFGFLLSLGISASMLFIGIAGLLAFFVVPWFLCETMGSKKKARREKRIP